MIAGTGNMEYFDNHVFSESDVLFSQPDTSDLRFPFSEKGNYPYSNSGLESPLYLRQPSNIKQIIEYDPATRQYYFTEKIGDLYW